MNYLIAAILLVTIILFVKNYKELARKLRNSQLSIRTKKIHNHFLLANLGIISGCVICIPSSIFGRWIFGHTICVGYAFLSFLTGILVINLMAVMAIDCYCQTTKKPLPVNIDVMINISWLSALLWSALPLFEFGKYDLELNGLACGIDFTNSSTVARLYMLSLVIFGFGLPIGIAAMFHSFTLKRERQMVDRNRKPNFTLNRICRRLLLLDILSWSVYVYLAIGGVLLGYTNCVTVVMTTLAPLVAKIGSALLPKLYPSHLS